MNWDTRVTSQWGAFGLKSYLWQRCCWGTRGNPAALNMLKPGSFAPFRVAEFDLKRRGNDVLVQVGEKRLAKRN
ncbi:MAG: hypothetical protein HWE23_10370 [Rhodobacteraceae bacterium]|nr:hypothetical protein [Paracoccaceae bacterium]